MLRTFEVTPGVRRIPPSKRLAYLAARVDRWIRQLRRRYKGHLFLVEGGQTLRDKAKTLSQLPSCVSVAGVAREILALAGSGGVGSVYITKIGGLRHRAAKRQLEWFCVRALIAVRVEGVTSGLQCTEDRFVLVRASSVKDAKGRLRQQWGEYARPYLNSDGRMVSWQMERVVDVYDLSWEIDASGTEVYSKLCSRRMRPKYVWRSRVTRGVRG
jgi:hypothetical protein